MKQRLDYRFGSLLAGSLQDPITRAFLKRDLVLVLRHAPGFLSGLVVLGIVLLITFFTREASGNLFILYYIPAYFAHSFLSSSLKREGSSQVVVQLLMEKKRFFKSKFLGTFFVVCGLAWMATLLISFLSPILEASLSLILIRLFLLLFASAIGSLVVLAFTAPVLRNGKTSFTDTLTLYVFGILNASAFYMLDLLLVERAVKEGITSSTPLYFYFLTLLIIGAVVALSFLKLRKYSRS